MKAGDDVWVLHDGVIKSGVAVSDSVVSWQHKGDERFLSPSLSTVTCQDDVSESFLLSVWLKSLEFHERAKELEKFASQCRRNRLKNRR